jgi:hypothetical protein
VHCMKLWHPRLLNVYFEWVINAITDGLRLVSSY